MLCLHAQTQTHTHKINVNPIKMHTSVSELPACLTTKIHTTVPNIIDNTIGLFHQDEIQEKKLHNVHDVSWFWQKHRGYARWSHVTQKGETLCHRADSHTRLRERRRRSEHSDMSYLP